MYWTFSTPLSWILTIQNTAIDVRGGRRMWKEIDVVIMMEIRLKW